MSDEGDDRDEPGGHRVLDYRGASGVDAGPALAPDDSRLIEAELRRRKHPSLGWWRFGSGLLWVGGVGFFVGYVMTGGNRNSDYSSARGRWGFVIAMVCFVVALAGALILSIVKSRVMRERGRRRDDHGAA